MKTHYRYLKSKDVAKKLAKELAKCYGDKYPGAIEVPEDDLEDSLIFFDSPSPDSRKINSSLL